MRKTDKPEDKKCYFRASGRTFQMNGAWFFSSREGDVGPFQSQKAAEVELTRYVNEQVALGEFQQSREQRVDPLEIRKANPDWRHQAIPTLRVEAG